MWPGRMFDWQLLDMFEMQVDNFIAMDTIGGDKALRGGKPMFVFQGDEVRCRCPVRVTQGRTGGMGCGRRIPSADGAEYRRVRGGPLIR